MPIAAARERAADGGLAFVHPFDDPAIIAGQGTLGLELLEDVPDLAQGGRAGRRRRACLGRRDRDQGARPDVEVVGVQAAAARVPASLRAASRRVDPTLTIADGIAVSAPAS